MKKISNLAWIDLEMTGLDANNDVIVEIACIVTDKDLNIIAEGPSLVLNTTEEKLSAMNDWVKNAHTKSGLIDLIRTSNVTIQEAETKAIEFFEQFCFIGISPLCGNSIWNDRIFLKRYMPALDNFFNYRIIDVSSVKEIVRRWYQDNPNINFYKKESHRALNDIRESINELNHYRKFFFIN